MPAAETEPDLKLEIAHLLLIDVVGYSRLLVNEQIEWLQALNKIVRNTQHFLAAEASGKLIRLPTGDGMALLFFHSPEEPVQCALEISEALKQHPQIQVRMGIHSGPVNEVTDVNDRSNIAGAGINVAQRVMDCGDAGHILLSKHLADDLAQYRHWQPFLHDLGEFEVKHGLRLHLVNLYKDNLGNSALPVKLQRRRSWKRPLSEKPFRSVSAMRWPKFALAAALSLSVLAILISGLIVFRRSGTEPTSGGSSLRTNTEGVISEKSIAVLPFENLSEVKQNTFFIDGVQDEILNDLAKVADLKVISRTSVMQYKSGVVRNLRQVAKELRVAHILEGTVQRVGNRVRVSAQLIDASSDAHVWAERYDRELTDVFALESELAENIVAALKAKLSPSEKAAIEEPPTADLVAYDYYLQAKSILVTAAFNVREKEKLFEAAQLLQKAVERDPRFLLAYYHLARTHDRVYILGIDHTAARLALANTAIKAALNLRPDSGEAHLAVAAHLYSGYLDYTGARRELTIAARALPNEPLVFELTGYIDRRQNRWEDCIRNLQRASNLDPRNFFILQQIALACQKLRRFEEKAFALDRVLALIPNDVGSRVERSMTDFEWRADPKPLHTVIDAVIAEDPSAVPGIADSWLYLALCERDHRAAQNALAAMPEGECRIEGIPFPRAWCEALAARTRDDGATAKSALIEARKQMAKVVLGQPDYAEALCVLGLIDSGLGRKEDAIREGRRAAKLLPMSKDAINGALIIQYLAVIYAWTGEKDLALEELALAATVPSDVNYGQLRFHPYWDPLRGDPRFEKIVASLAPK